MSGTSSSGSEGSGQQMTRFSVDEGKETDGLSGNYKCKMDTENSCKSFRTSLRSPKNNVCAANVCACVVVQSQTLHLENVRNSRRLGGLASLANIHTAKRKGLGRLFFGPTIYPPSVISSKSCWTVVPQNGVAPIIISYKMTPIDHQSTA